MTKKTEEIEIKVVDPQEAFKNKDKAAIIALEKAASLDFEKDFIPVSSEEINRLLEEARRELDEEEEDC